MPDAAGALLYGGGDETQEFVVVEPPPGKVVRDRPEPVALARTRLLEIAELGEVAENPGRRRLREPERFGRFSRQDRVRTVRGILENVECFLQDLDHDSQ